MVEGKGSYLFKRKGEETRLCRLDEGNGAGAAEEVLPPGGERAADMRLGFSLPGKARRGQGGDGCGKASFSLSSLEAPQ